MPCAGCGAAGVVAGAQFTEPGGGVGQQVPDDDQDGAGDGDEGARGLRSPAISASIMSRTDLMVIVLATADTLIRASSSSFSSRDQCRLRSRVRSVRSRV